MTISMAHGLVDEDFQMEDSLLMVGWASCAADDLLDSSRSSFHWEGVKERLLLSQSWWERSGCE